MGRVGSGKHTRESKRSASRSRSVVGVGLYILCCASAVGDVKSERSTIGGVRRLHSLEEDCFMLSAHSHRSSIAISDS